MHQRYIYGSPLLIQPAETTTVYRKALDELFFCRNFLVQYQPIRLAGMANSGILV